MDHEKSLFMKYLDGKAGPDEKKQLLGYFKNNPEARQELQSTYTEWTEKYGKLFDPYPSLDCVLEKVSRKRPFVFPALAAVAVAIAALFIIIPLRKSQNSSVPAVETELYTWPESENPMVLLSDGQVINSDAIEMQISCTPRGIRIDGHDYSFANSQKAPCMIAVPYGHRARVQFADGSVVRMNAHSRIVFPVRFGKERAIHMTGEALFDVSRDEGRPFIVNLDDVHIQVLGTRFLVSGYEEEARRVALISGSVNVSLGDSGAQSVTLVPNQMYTLDDNGKINVEDVSDWDGLLDWANGVYKADGTSMKDLLAHLSRYYGEKVECDARVAGISCTGTLYLRNTLSDMLSELSGIFPIKSHKQDRIWFVSLSRE